jgi:hypothetical protein
MAEAPRVRTIGEMLGLNAGEKAKSAAFRRYLELDIRTSEELAALKPHDRDLWLVFRFEQEVMGGGIDAILSNSSGEYTRETIDALNAIQARSAEAWLTDVCGRFPGGRPSQDELERRNQIETICGLRADGAPERLDRVIPGKLDENLFELLMEYWRRSEAA